MSKLYKNIKNHPHYAKALYWGKLISVTGSAQMVVQAVGFISGILVIRMLPVEEYAIYTLANTMLGTMTVLSDGGISTGVMAQGGKVWQDREKLGAVLATGLDLRRKFAIGSLIISIPILAYLLHTHGASWLTITLITVSLIPAFFAALSDTLLQIPAKLHQAILPLQRNQVEVGIGRLVLTGISIFAFPWAFVAVLASGIPRMYGNIKLRKIANVFVDKEQKPDEEVRGEILKIVKKILPISIYYAVSGQLTIWLISVFGNTSSIAQLGALGRLTAMFSIFSIVFGILIVPRYAKLADNLLLKRFGQIFIGLFLLASFSTILCYIFSNQLLWLLGDNYTGLDEELTLYIISSWLGIISGVIFSLYTVRGWAMKPLIVISLNISIIIGLILMIDMSELRGVLFFNIFLMGIILLFNIVYCLYKILVLKLRNNGNIAEN